MKYILNKLRTLKLWILGFILRIIRKQVPVVKEQPYDDETIQRVKELITYKPENTVEEYFIPLRNQNIKKINALNKRFIVSEFDVEGVDQHNSNLDTSAPTIEEIKKYNDQMSKTVFYYKENPRYRELVKKALVRFRISIDKTELKTN